MQPHKRLSKHVQGVKAAADARLLQLRAVASPECGPDKKLRAFYRALVLVKVCYGIASWWFDTSLSDRERLEKVQAQAAHIVAGIPKAANRDDAMCEARLKPINEVAHRRALEYYLRLKAKESTQEKIAESIFLPEHPIHVRLAKVKHLYSIDGTGKQHDATVLKLARRVHFNTTTPGGLKADAPEKDKKMHTMRRVVRFRDFDYQVWTDGSVVLDVSSGAGALVYPKEGRRKKVVLGAGSLACSYRAECVAMEAGLKRLADVIELNQTHRTRVVVFTNLLSLRMALSTGPAAVEDAILRRILDLILRLVRLRVSVNFQFVFSHCGVPRNEAADKAAEQGNAKPQTYPVWVTDIVAAVERQILNEMYRSFEEGRMLRTHRSVLLDHFRPAPKHTKLDRLGESFLAQFKEGTSKHFGWLHRVLTRKTDRLECRSCRVQDIGGAAAEDHPLAKPAVDSANAPDFGIATRQSDPIICPLCNMVCARRQAGVVHLVKIHGFMRDRALAMAKNSRLATQTYKNGYTCHVCGDAFERRGLLVEHMAQHPRDVMPTDEERPKMAREEDEADGGKAFKCCWCAKRYTVYARLRKHMIQKHPEKQLKSDDIPVEQEASSDSDGEPVQEEQNFVCQKCDRVLKSKTWLTRQKCDVTSNINSEVRMWRSSRSQQRATFAANNINKCGC
ncbi:unnamed protein product [Trypanosoma congolense IL3000]|uniref:WGS project CAEQ00000000 data, annotated contig 234 n=1 Tax=Trypanosoma congolense (strain IL3000) TaxID=1068625 RepID=F9WDA4_TRYCI|nr:unnamed protein product [Trypanosoma congolense IL3000]